jgi:hypothetical protein
MTVAQLRQHLAMYPDNMEVFFAEIETGFKYAPVEEIYEKDLNCMEDPDGSVFATDKVLILDSI